MKEIIKKIKLNIKNTSLKMKIFLAALAAIYIKNQAFYLMTWSGNSLILPFITIGFIALLLLPMLYMKKTKKQIIYGLVINVLVTALLLSNAIYYEYANNFLSLFQISNAKYGGEIMSALPSLFKIYHIVFILDFLIIIPCAIMKKIKLEKEVTYTKKERNIVMASIVVLAMFSAGYAYFKPEESLKKRFWSKNTLISQSTLFGYHFYDAVNFFSGIKNVPYKTFNEVAETYKTDMDAKKVTYDMEKYLDVTNIAEGKNVILLQLEAIQNFIINEKINGKEITPNINKWLAENVNFTNMHAQGLGTTADSEHTVLNSLYPLENGSAYQFYAGNKYYNLLQEPKQKGYYTSFMHANDKGFWNRFNVYKNIGVDVFEDIKAFEPVDERINCWLSDELFFDRAVDKLESYPKPFLTNMVAVSSHYPFSLEGIKDKETKVTIDVSPYKDSLFGNYLETANYVDYAFGKLIEELKEKGLYDETVLIIYGDHYAMNIDDKNMLAYMQSIGKPLNKIEQKINYTNVACGMSIPGVKSMVINDPVGKADIKPTILKMIGAEDKFSIGKDMFLKDDYVYISNYNVITNEDMYADGKWYNIESGEELKNISPEKQERLNKHVERMSKEIQISESIVKKDLFKDEEQVNNLFNELREQSKN